MSWTPDELTRIGAAEELEVSSYREDGTRRPFVTIWVVRVGDDVVVRSAYGPRNGWFRHAQESGRGRIRAGGVEKDVTFEDIDPGDPVNERIDAVYRQKYGAGSSSVVAITADVAREATLKVRPR